MKSILAVDDSASVRQMVGFVLRGAGFEVVEAVDGVDALDKLSSRSFDLILTDQNMPNMDGLTLVRKVRSDQRHVQTPILMLTTESSVDMKSQGKAAGATGWLVKPFDPARLTEVIYKVLPR